MNNLTFGGSQAYYDQLHTAPKRALNKAETHIEALLKRYDPDLQQRVGWSFKQWNGILRDYIRTATGLRLSIGEEQQAVPVKIVAGLPRPLEELIGGIDPALWELIYNRPIFESTVRGFSTIDRLYSPLTDHYLEPSVAMQFEVQHTREFVQQLLKALDNEQLANDFKALGRDVLGAYFFRVPEIHLYWMAIGLMAGVLGVPVETLTLVVLIHELAHAYKHLGCDIDGERWETQVFAACDLRIVEGLAQFYTAAICQKLEARTPTIKTAFESLMLYQGEPYVVHKDWVNNQRGAGEVVRGSMVESRSNGVTDYGRFLDIMDRFKKQIPKHSGRTTT